MMPANHVFFDLDVERQGDDAQFAQTRTLRIRPKNGNGTGSPATGRCCERGEARKCHCGLQKKAPLQAKRQAHPCLPFCLPPLFVFVFRTEEFMINRLSSSVRRANSDSRVIKALSALSRSPSLPMISSRWAAANAFFVAKLPTEPFSVCAALPNAPASPQRIAFLIFARP
jgi:hypothetical protein